MGNPVRRTAGQELFEQHLAFRQGEAAEQGRKTGQDILAHRLVRGFRCDQGKEFFRHRGIQDLAGIVKSEMDNSDIYRDKIRKIKTEEIYNFGRAGEAAAKQLVEMLKK